MKKIKNAKTKNAFRPTWKLPLNIKLIRKIFKSLEHILQASKGLLQP